MKRTVKSGLWAAVVVVLCVCAMIAHAASVDMPADAWDTQTQIQAAVTKEDSSVTVGFGPDSSPPSVAMASLVAGAVGDGAAFAGDFVAAGINGIALQIAKSPDADAPRVKVELRSGKATAMPWVYTLTANADGSATDVSVPLDIPGTRVPEGWSRSGFTGGAADQRWAADLQNVHSLRIVVQRGTADAETSVLSDFELKGDDFIYPFDINLDSDGDGMSDLAEQAAGTDENDRNDVFQAEFEDTSSSEGVTIRWRCVPEASYKVERAGSLNGTFVDVATVVAPAAAYATYTDGTATGDGPYFYRISKQ